MTTPKGPTRYSGFPPYIFGKMSRDGRYTGTAACIHVLEGARELMGLTKYQLGRLLGTASVDAIYHWFAGRSRPSSLFVTRLVELQLMFMDGVPLYNASYIEWAEGKIHWRNGEVTDCSVAHLFKSQRTRPTKQQRATDPEWEIPRPA